LALDSGAMGLAGDRFCLVPEKDERRDAADVR
jgi:hypothetical protein